MQPNEEACRYRYDSLDRVMESTPSARAATLLATDQQHSVLTALDGTQPHSFAYTPYGHRPSGNGLLSLLGFNGEQRDPVTGHYLLGNGYRAFNPVLMRFNSPDSWSPFGEGGLNAYAYCVGDPINLIDPTGHFFGIAKLQNWARRLLGRPANPPRSAAVQTPVSDSRTHQTGTSSSNKNSNSSIHTQKPRRNLSRREEPVAPPIHVEGFGGMSADFYGARPYSPPGASQNSRYRPFNRGLKPSDTGSQTERHNIPVQTPERTIMRGSSGPEPKHSSETVASNSAKIRNTVK